MELRFGRGFAPPLRRSFRRHRLGETWKTAVTKVRQSSDSKHHIIALTANTIVETVGTARRRARVRYADLAKSALYLTRAQFFFDLNAQLNRCCTVFATGKVAEARVIRLRHMARETLETQCEPPIAPVSWDDFWRTGKNLEGELPHSI